MKKYARILSLLFALVMLLSVFASCAITAEPETTTDEIAGTVDGSEDGTDTEASNVDEDGYQLPTLPDNLDYGKENVTVLYWDDVERIEFEVKYEDASDIVEEAIYRRNITTEDKLGIKFEWIGTAGNNKKRKEFVSHVQTSYASGVYYDLVAAYSRTSAMLCVDGLLEDINTIDDNYIDLSMPWWPKSMKETCSIDDSLFFVSGDISTNMLHFMYAVYYNIDMLKNLNLEDPVEKVDDMTWTLDALIEYSKDLYQDADNSSNATVDDIYGFCSSYAHLDAFYSGSDLMLVEDDPDGVLMISDDYWSQKAVDMVDKLVAWFAAGDSLIQKYSQSLAYEAPFERGRALFCQNRVYMADNKYNDGALRNVTWEYGILPTPLYDEDQDNYITLLGNPITLWAIMKNAKDPSMSSAVLECLASEAYRKTSPALFENNMKYRYTPDLDGKGDGARMFDIIRDGITFDLGRIFSDSLEYMSEIPSKAAADGKSWSSQLASKKPILKRKMDDLNKALEKMITS